MTETSKQETGSRGSGTVTMMVSVAPVQWYKCVLVLALLHGCQTARLGARPQSSIGAILGKQSSSPKFTKDPIPTTTEDSKLQTTSEAPIVETQLPIQDNNNFDDTVYNDRVLVGVNGRIVSGLGSWSKNGEDMSHNQRPWQSTEELHDVDKYEKAEAVPNGKVTHEGPHDTGEDIEIDQVEPRPGLFENGGVKVSSGRMATDGFTLDSVTHSEVRGERVTRDATDDMMTTSDHSELVTRDDSKQHHNSHPPKAENHRGKQYDALSHAADTVTPDSHDSTMVTQDKDRDIKTMTPEDDSRTHVFHLGFRPETMATADDESTVTRPDTVTLRTDDSLGFNELDVDESELSIEEVVLTLRAQLHESQTSQIRTRSVLNTIEDKQLAIERDVLALKEDVRRVRDAQREDHLVIVSMQALVEDNTWGVANIKTNQNQQTTDLQGLKGWLEMHNDTILQLEQLSWSREVTQLHQGSFLQELNKNIQDLTDSASEDRHALNSLKHLVHSKLSNNAAHSNRINLRESANAANATQWEKQAAALEEMSNMVEHQLQQLSQKEHQIQKKVSGMDFRVGQYDGELAKLYTLFYNLSLQMSSLENRILNQKQHAVESELGSLQQSFVNFTQQLFTMEQWHAANRNALNTTYSTQGHMTEVLGQHDGRLSTIESILLDHQTHTKLRHNKVSHSLTKMNETVSGMHKSMEEHRFKASNVFQNVDQELSAFRGQVQGNSDRLLQLEVQVLNASLLKCQKVSSDLKQDMKLSEFSNDIGKMRGRIGVHTSQIARLDRGVSQLFREVEAVTKTTTSMLDDITDLLHLTPEVVNLQQEVDNFVAQLPQDCSDIGQATSVRRNRLYLVKPEKSTSSTQTFCEFDDANDEEWTYIQRRFDGSVPFDRTWEEYKVGFGAADSEFWIGNDNLHFLTNQAEYVLRIDMWDLQNQYLYAEYDLFKVEDAASNYRLHIDGYQGNATNALKYANFMPFSTLDTDNDFSSTHCAKFYTAGWWYKHCHYGNLNGRYTVGVVWFNHDLDEWVQLRKTVMKIRRVNETSVNLP